MADNRQKLVHLHSSDVKMPAQGLLDLGEIAVQHNDVEAALYIEKSNGEIAKFIDVTAVDAKVEVEKLRAEGAEEALADKIETDEIDDPEVALANKAELPASKTYVNMWWSLLLLIIILITSYYGYRKVKKHNKENEEKLNK